MYNKIMTWEELKQRKEESIRESTNNPMIKNTNPVVKNGKTYKSYSEYLQSEEYQQFLEAEVNAELAYKQKAKDYFQSLDTDTKLLLFYHITSSIYENYFIDKGSYRGLLYSKFDFGPEAYGLGYSSGMFALHNAIFTPDELDENFNKLLDHLKLDLSNKEIDSLKRIFIYGVDTSKSLDHMITGQQKFKFDEEQI
jgi:hypothetical protein